MTSNDNGMKHDAEDGTMENPKIIGFYKRQAWALKFFDKIDEGSIESDGEHSILAPSVLQSQNGLYFPAFLSIDLMQKGQVAGAYLVSEDDSSISLIPLEKVMPQLEKEQILPFKYRTINEIPEDQFQKNWPDFS